MKYAVLILLGIAILLNLAALQMERASGVRASRDYEEIVEYILRVEKVGFSQTDFEAFSLARKRMRKEVLLQHVLPNFCFIGSALLSAVSLGLVAFKWSQK